MTGAGLGGMIASFGILALAMSHAQDAPSPLYNLGQYLDTPQGRAMLMERCAERPINQRH
jgi:hypothetical protein